MTAYLYLHQSLVMNIFYPFSFSYSKGESWQNVFPTCTTFDEIALVDGLVQYNPRKRLTAAEVRYIFCIRTHRERKKRYRRRYNRLSDLWASLHTIIQNHYIHLSAPNKFSHTLFFPPVYPTSILTGTRFGLLYTMWQWCSQIYIKNIDRLLIWRIHVYYICIYVIFFNK